MWTSFLIADEASEWEVDCTDSQKVKMPMATVARWKNGCIAEEHLFWDNAEYMKQLGIGQ